MKRIIYLILVLNVFKYSAQTNCQTVKSGSFTDSTVWNTGFVPDTTDNVIVDAGDTLYITNDRSAHHVTIYSGGVIMADSGIIFSIRGNYSNSGKFLADNSTVRFIGTNAQTVSGNSVTTFYNLEFDNAAGVSFTKDQRVRGVATVAQGTVSLGSYKLILLSDSMRTASIGPLLNGADIVGKITVQRYLTGYTTGWRFLGSPVRTRLTDWKSDFLTSGFPGSHYPNFNFCSIYKYDETVMGTSENGYVMPTHSSDSLLPGNGYWCWVGPTPDLVDVTGFPKKGDHEFNVSLTPDAGKAEDGWNLVANPYPSAIDWDANAWTKTGIQNAIYIWDPETDQYSTYINGIGINGGTNIIASSQAFWVQSNQSNPVLSCTEEVKTVDDVNVNKSVLPSVLRLKVSGSNGYDETVIAFRSNATSSVSPFEDAIKLFTDNPQVPSLTSVADSADLAVNVMPLSPNMQIPVRVKVGASGVYTLSSLGFSFPDNSCVFVEDMITGSKTNIRDSFSYTFAVADTATAPRFMIHISKPVLTAAKSPDCSYKSNGKIKLMNSLGACNYTLLDEIGNALLTHVSASGVDSIMNLNPGNYVVEVGNNQAFCPYVSEVLVVPSVSELKAEVSVSGNLCKNDQAGVIHINNISGGTQPYSVKWENGENTLLRKNLSPGVYTAVIRDAKGCADTSFYAVSSLSMLQSKFSIVSDSTQLVQNYKIRFKNQSAAYNQLAWQTRYSQSQEEEPEFIFPHAGTHTVVLVAKDAHCESRADYTVNISRLPLTSEPAPYIFSSGDNAVIEFPSNNGNAYHVYVYSADGKLIHEKNLTDPVSSATIPLGTSHGIYVVKCERDGIVTVNKLLK